MKVTKEDKEIAVGMWEMIRDDWVKNPSVRLDVYKHRYLARFGYGNKWRNDCLLCSYYSFYANGTPYPYFPCRQCPLDSCTEFGSAYSRVCNVALPLQDRIDACNTIIKCIEDIEVTDEKA